MQEKKFLEYFRDSLYARYSEKELVSLLADILRVDREPVARRLHGKVLFTADEVGLIAREMGISLDDLINKKPGSVSLSLDLLKPLEPASIDAFTKDIKDMQDKIKKMSGKPLHIGHIFSSLPLEFYGMYKYLCKFLLFGFKYHFTSDNSKLKYENWQFPSWFETSYKELSWYLTNTKSVSYIWDKPVIWNLVKEIELFYQLKIVNDNEVLLIKKDLHDMLDNIERYISNIESDKLHRSFELYISNIHIGFSCAYCYTDEYSLVSYRMPFAWSMPHSNTIDFEKVYIWMNSMKKVSTLISGSGAINRRIFFEEQHTIVDNGI